MDRTEPRSGFGFSTSLSLVELAEDPLEVTGYVGGSLHCRHPWAQAQGYPAPSQVAMGLGDALCQGLARRTLLGPSVDMPMTLMNISWATQG